LSRNWKSRTEFEKAVQHSEKSDGNWKFQPEILKSQSTGSIREALRAGAYTVINATAVKMRATHVINATAAKMKATHVSLTPAWINNFFGLPFSHFPGLYSMVSNREEHR